MLRDRHPTSSCRSISSSRSVGTVAFFSPWRCLRFSSLTVWRALLFQVPWRFSPVVLPQVLSSTVWRTLLSGNRDSSPSVFNSCFFRGLFPHSRSKQCSYVTLCRQWDTSHHFQQQIQTHCLPSVMRPAREILDSFLQRQVPVFFGSWTSPFHSFSSAQSVDRSACRVVRSDRGRAHSPDSSACFGAGRRTDRRSGSAPDLRVQALPTVAHRPSESVLLRFTELFHPLSSIGYFFHTGTGRTLSQFIPQVRTELMFRSVDRGPTPPHNIVADSQFQRMATLHEQVAKVYLEALGLLFFAVLTVLAQEQADCWALQEPRLQRHSRQLRMASTWTRSGATACTNRLPGMFNDFDGL